MKIAVVGASGEIGSRLTQYLLKQKIPVHAIGRTKSARLARWSELEFYPIDLQNKEEVEKALVGCDIVINCALDKQNNSLADDLIEKNVLVLKNLFEASIKAGVTRFFHLSSIVVLPPQISKSVLSHPYIYSQELDWYTRTKVETEKLALSYRGKMQVVVIRPGIVYGPFMNWSGVAFSRVTSSIVMLPATMGPGCLAVHVDDVVGLLVSAALTTLDLPEFLFAVNPEPISWSEFYQQHGEAIGKKYNNFKVLPDFELRNIVKKRTSKQKLTSKIIFYYSKVPGFIQLLKPIRILVRVMKGILYNQPVESSGSTVASIPKFVPDEQELKMYLSNGYPTKEQTGSTINYTYSVPLKDGVQMAGKWWNYHL